MISIFDSLILLGYLFYFNQSKCLRSLVAWFMITNLLFLNKKLGSSNNLDNSKTKNAKPTYFFDVAATFKGMIFLSKKSGGLRIPKHDLLWDNLCI